MAQASNSGSTGAAPVENTPEGRHSTLNAGGTNVRLSQTSDGRVVLARDRNRDGRYTPDEELYSSDKVAQFQALVDATWLGGILNNSTKIDRLVQQGVQEVFSDGVTTIREMRDTLALIGVATETRQLEMMTLRDALESLKPDQTPAVPSASDPSRRI